MSTYYYLAKMKLLVSLTYRFEVFTSLGTNLIILLAYMFLWKAAYNGIDIVGGVNESQMITYAMMSVLLASFFTQKIEETLEERITQGDIAIDFFRPVNLILNYFSEDVGVTVSAVISKLIPMIIIMFLFIQEPLPASFSAFILFILSSVLSFLILWLMSALIALTCFWVLQLGNLRTIKDGVIILISGRIIPLWLFPENVQSVLKFLPFQYIYQTPLSIYIGQMPSSQIAFSLFIQFVWVALFIGLISYVWTRARRRVLVQGG